MNRNSYSLSHTEMLSAVTVVKYEDGSIAVTVSGDDETPRSEKMHAALRILHEGIAKTLETLAQNAIK